MERLVVSGVDGPLGMNLALALADRWQVLGLYDRVAVEADSLTCAARPTAPAELVELVRQHQPRWLIHCGPMSAGAWDPPLPENPDEPRAMSELVHLANELGAQLMVFSSDAVLAGPRMFHDEKSPGVATGGRHARWRAIEQALAAAGALVVRTHAYGWSPVEAHAGFAETAFEALVTRGSLRADGRRYATPILATDLAELLLRAYERRLHGLYHMAGAERTSAFRFVAEMANVMGIDGRRRFDIRPAADDSPDQETSLSSRRARRELDMTTAMLRQGLTRFAAQRDDNWRGRWRVLGPLREERERAA